MEPETHSSYSHVILKTLDNQSSIALPHPHPVSTDTGVNDYNGNKVRCRSVSALISCPMTRHMFCLMKKYELWDMKHGIHTDMNLNSNTLLHAGCMWNISQWLKWTSWEAMVVFYIQLWLKQMGLQETLEI